MLEAKGCSSCKHTAGELIWKTSQKCQRWAARGKVGTAAQRGWLWAQTGSGLSQIRSRLAANKRQPRAKYLLYMVPKVSNPPKMQGMDEIIIATFFSLRRQLPQSWSSHMKLPLCMLLPFYFLGKVCHCAICFRPHLHIFY